MGTRGHIIYRFRGRYYAYYNHFDSYPHGLGKEVVAGIPSGDIKKYKQWLLVKRQQYSRLEQQLDQTKLTIEPEEIRNGETDQKIFTIISREFSTLPSSWPLTIGIWNEWTYIIDLDCEIFSVDFAYRWDFGQHVDANNVSPVHFHLHDIPANWDQLLNPSKSVDAEAEEEEEEDTETSEEAATSEWMVGGPHVIPNYHDERPTGSIKIPRMPINEQLIYAYSRLNVTIIKPKTVDGFLPGKRNGVLFAERLFQSWAEEKHYMLNHFMPPWTSESPAFREVAFAFLCCAAGFHEGFTVKGVNKTQANGRLITEMPDIEDQSETPELLGELCAGFHLPGNSPWICPSEEIFLFKGVHVLFSLDLDDEDVARSCIAKVVKNGARRGFWTFHCVIMSLHHVILVRVVENYWISHTRVLPLNSDLPSKSVVDKNLGDVGVEPHANGFVALAHMFEAIMRESLSRTATQGRLPSEIYMRIIDFTDPLTRHQCSNTSRTFRAYCQQKFVFLDALDEMVSENGQMSVVAPNNKIYDFFCLEEDDRDGNWARRSIPRYLDTLLVPVIGPKVGARAVLTDVVFGFCKRSFKIDQL